MTKSGKKAGHLTIVSCGIGEQTLSLAARQAVEAGTVLYGPSKLLALFPNFKGERKMLAAETQEYINTIVKTQLDHQGQAVVLIHGDALFFGLAHRFAELLPTEHVTIIPGVSCAQAFFAKLKQPWESTRFFLVHGRDAHIPWREILNSKCAAVCCDAIHPATRLAAELLQKWPHAISRPAAIGENIGQDNERIEFGNLESLSVMECAGNSMLALLPYQSEDWQSPGLPFGLGGEEFPSAGEPLTQPELRAIVISKLRPGPGIIWDIGSGMASVGLEACGLCPDLQLYVLEPGEERAEKIRKRAHSMALNGFQVLVNDPVNEIPLLPRPRAVVLGGSVPDAGMIIEAAYKKLLPGGVMVALAETMENRVTLDETLKFACSEVLSISLSKNARPEGADRRFMRPLDPVEIYVYTKPHDEEKE